MTMSPLIFNNTSKKKKFNQAAEEDLVRIDAVISELEKHIENLLDDGVDVDSSQFTLLENKLEATKRVRAKVSNLTVRSAEKC